MFESTPELTFVTAKAALAEGLRAIESGQQVIDLALVRHVDSSAVTLLLAWRRAALARSTPLTFSHPPASLVSLAALYGVADLLQVDTEVHRTDLPHH